MRWLPLVLIACGVAEERSPAPPADPGPVAMRRLTSHQVRELVHDVLGDEIEVPDRFEPETRRLGLDEVGAAVASVTPSGLEGLEAMARSVAAQALAPEHRDALVPCTPTTDQGPDDACADAVLRPLARRLLRRPVTDEDLAPRIALAREAASTLGDFHAGLELGLTSLLLAPDTLFRVEEVDEDGWLTDLSLASRLSFLLWNGPPDEPLLKAAERGELRDSAVLQEQAERLLMSPRLTRGVRAFFSDLLELDAMAEVRKDEVLYGTWSQQIADDTVQQTLRTITTHLLDDHAPYPTLWTTRDLEMTRSLGVLYQVPVTNPTGWSTVTLPEDDPRAGLLTHVSLLALHAHPGRSSATLRGRFVRETLLCETVPAPPGDVDFSAIEEITGDRPTARDRLSAHDAPACAGCHGLMDPIGLGLEQFDTIGAFRTTENGAPIDPSGELDGTRYADAVGLGRALASHENLGPCFVDHLYRYAVAREIEEGEAELVSWLSDQFADQEHRLRPLLLDLVMSDGFRRSSGPKEAE